jgi:hypothetical protein
MIVHDHFLPLVVFMAILLAVVMRPRASGTKARGLPLAILPVGDVGL